MERLASDEKTQLAFYLEEVGIPTLETVEDVFIYPLKSGIGIATPYKLNQGDKLVWVTHGREKNTVGIFRVTETDLGVRIHKEECLVPFRRHSVERVKHFWEGIPDEIKQEDLIHQGEEE